MVQSQTQPIRRIAFPILIALSVSHCLNDLLQSVISAVYPLFKEDLSLSFAQIGLITLVYQMSASVFQPLTGLIFDKRPIAWSLPIGMSFTLIGMLNLAFASNLNWLLASVFIIVRLFSIRKHPVSPFWLREENGDWHNHFFR